MSPDTTLLRSFATGRDQDAFAELVRRHGALVFATCLRATQGDRSAAEDAMQEVFTELAMQAGRIRGALPAWLYVVARRRGAAQRRRERLSESAAEPGDTGAAARGELRVLVEEALEHLADDQRAVVVLRFLEQRSQEEIAGLLGISQATVSRRLQAGLDRLRGLIGAPAVLLPLPGVLQGMAAPPLAAPVAAKLGTLALGLTPAISWGVGTLLAMAVTVLVGITGVTWWQWPVAQPTPRAAVAEMTESPRHELAAWRAAAQAFPLPTYMLDLRLVPDEHDVSQQAAIPNGLITQVNGMPVAELTDYDEVLNKPGTTLTVQRLWRGERPLITTDEALNCWHPGAPPLRMVSSTVVVEEGHRFLVKPHEDLRLLALRSIPEGVWEDDLNQALQAYEARDWPTLLLACERLQAAQAPDGVIRLLGSIAALYSPQPQTQQRWMQVKPGDAPLLANLLGQMRKLAAHQQREDLPPTWKPVGLDGLASGVNDLVSGGATYVFGRGGREDRIAWSLPTTDVDFAWRIRIKEISLLAPNVRPRPALRVILGDALPSVNSDLVVQHPIQEITDLSMQVDGYAVSKVMHLRAWLPQQEVSDDGPSEHRIRVRVVGRQALIWWDGVLLVNCVMADSPKGLWLLTDGLTCIHFDLAIHAPVGADPLPLSPAMLADDPVALQLGDPATVMRLAAFSGKTRILSAAMQQHPDLIDIGDSSSETPLQLAAFAGYAPLARQLLAAHADPNRQNQWGWTAFDYALRIGIPQAGFLSPKADSDLWLTLLKTPMKPTEMASLDAIGRLPPAVAALAIRGDVEAALATGDRDPRLAFVAIQMHMDQVLERLKAAGVPMTGIYPWTQETLLHWAIARRRDPGLARTLLRLGVDPHVQARWGADAVATARNLGMVKLAHDLDQEARNPEVKNNF